MTDPITSALGVRLAELTDDVPATSITAGPVRERGRRLRARRRALGASAVAAVVAAGFGISSLVTAPRHDATPARPSYPRHGLQLDDVAGYSVWLDDSDSPLSVCASRGGDDAGSSCKSMPPVDNVQLVVPTDDHAVAAGTIQLHGIPVEGFEVDVQVEGHPAVRARSTMDAKGRVLFAVAWRDLGVGPTVTGPVHVAARDSWGVDLARLDVTTPEDAKRWRTTTNDRYLTFDQSEIGSWGMWSVGDRTCVGLMATGDPLDENDGVPVYPRWCGGLGAADIAGPNFIVPLTDDHSVRLLRVPAGTLAATVDGHPAPVVAGVTSTWVVAPANTRPAAPIEAETANGKVRTTLEKALVDGVVVALE